MLNTIAKVISYIFHPLLMPLLAIFLIFNSGSYLSYYPFEGQKAIYMIIILSTIILPLCMIPVFLFIRLINNLEMTSRKERIIPYFIILVFYYFAYFILKRAAAPNVIISLILAAILAMSFTLVINFKWKISAHMVGIGGLTGVVLAMADRLLMDVTTLLMIVFLIAGIIGTARLTLDAHKPAEIYLGYGFGTLITGFTIMYL